MLAALRDVLRNPVRAGVITRPWDYQWSSAKWFAGEKEDDPLAIASDMLADITDRRSFALQEEDCLPEFRGHARTGRPLGSESFLTHLEKLTGRRLLPRKPGPKARSFIL